MADELIRTIGLEKDYQLGATTVPVLRGVYVSIPRGQFVAIMGPSGSGKSTLMHVLGFLDTPTRGAYYFNQQDVSRLDENTLARLRGEQVGFVFQAFYLLPNMTALDNVCLPLLYSTVPQEERRERAARVLAQVGLAHRQNHLSQQLSGGERQRVAIARALIRNPAIIFADEPTGNLDSASGTQVLHLLQTLHEKQGHTIVLVTHDQATAEHAERILHLADGRVVSDAIVPVRRRALATLPLNET